MVPVIIHGDAAFAGQGVVMETFQMSQTRGYHVGGTVHIIVNNQIGFTTHRLDDARSTEYCSEVAKMVRAPILHVNGDDPEACLFAVRLAVDYRMQFKKDVVIDLVCYRRRGHNEAEEPMKTQPLMYRRIHMHPTTRALYAGGLVGEGIVDRATIDGMVEDYRTALAAGEQVALSLVHEPDSSLFVDWTPYIGHDWDAPGDTRVPLARLRSLTERVTTVPDGFALHRQVQKILDDRRRMAAGAMARELGLCRDHGLRDPGGRRPRRPADGSGRGVGTFSHRHASLYNQKDGKRIVRSTPEQRHHLRHLRLAALGRSGAGLRVRLWTTSPGTLVIWEAQFGDFANGAQVVIDQFVVSGEAKWTRLCGLVLLLPHGYEGQGRNTRRRAWSATCNCRQSTTSRFACRRRRPRSSTCCRQVIRPLRKPLVALTPKSLLRHRFGRVDLGGSHPRQFPSRARGDRRHRSAAVDRVVLCSGKVYYELLEERRGRACERGRGTLGAALSIPGA